MTKTTERQLKNKIAQLEQRVNDAHTIFSALFLMDLTKTMPARTQRGIDDWLNNKLIFPVKITVPVDAALEKFIKRRNKANES